MREKETKSISFPEIDPETWEEMVDFLTLSRDADWTFEQLEKMVPFFDKYEFSDAISTADSLLCDLFPVKDIVRWPVDLLIKNIDLTNKSNLPRTKNQCVKSLKQVLNHKRARIRIYVYQWFRIASFITEHEKELWTPIEAVLCKVGISKKESLIEGDKESIRKTFLIIRALYEKSYAKSKGFRFPDSDDSDDDEDEAGVP
jgi:hypothetical protein